MEHFLAKQEKKITVNTVEAEALLELTRICDRLYLHIRSKVSCDEAIEQIKNFRQIYSAFYSNLSLIADSVDYDMKKSLLIETVLEKVDWLDD